MKNTTLLLAMMLLFGAFAVNAFAFPNTISYQGQLSDDVGNPLNENITATFTLYDNAVGGTAVWSEEQSFEVSDGIFNIELGSVENLDDVDFSTSYWLSIHIDGEAMALDPRVEITSVPYATNAQFITNGEINSTSIGNESAGAATFTTLSATGNTLDASSATISAVSVDLSSSTMYIPNSVGNGLVLTSDGSGKASWVALPSGVDLSGNETITGNWVNTANPWADDEVANDLTIDGGSIENTAIGDAAPAGGTFTGLALTTGASDGHVLTSDANGNATWEAAAGGGGGVASGLSISTTSSTAPTDFTYTGHYIVPSNADNWNSQVDFAPHGGTSYGESGQMDYATSGSFYIVDDEDFYRYDSGADTWETLDDLAEDRGDQRMIYSPTDNKVYVTGGTIAGNTDMSNLMYIYDIASDSWEASKNMGFKVAGHALSESSGTIFSIGGAYRVGGNFTSRDILKAYDVANDTWYDLANMPQVGHYNGAAIYNNKIYCFSAGSSHSNLTSIYDIATDSWSAGANSPVTFLRPYVQVVGDKIYVDGYIYDPVANSFSSITTNLVNEDYIYDGTEFWDVMSTPAQVYTESVIYYFHTKD